MSQDSPRVSVCIPVFNCERFLGQAVASALGQTYTDIEVIVVDNASDDDSCGVAGDYEDHRMRVYRNAENIGAAANWNRAVELASGEFIKILCADDVLEPTCLELQVAALDSAPGAVMCSAARTIVNEAGVEQMTRAWRRPDTSVSGADALAEIARTGTNLLGDPSAVLIRRKALETVGGFDAAAGYALDLDMWIRLLTVGDVVLVSEPLARYRVSGSSWSVAADAHQARDTVAALSRIPDDATLSIPKSQLAMGVVRAHVNQRLRSIFYWLLMNESRREKFMFLVVGVWNTIFGYLAFAALYYLLGNRVSYVVVLALAYMLSTLNAFVGSKYLVFRTRGNHVREYIRFSSVYVIALAANVVLLPIIQDLLGANAYVGQAVFTVGMVIVTYLGHKYFTFAPPRQAVSRSEGAARADERGYRDR